MKDLFGSDDDDDAAAPDAGDAEDGEKSTMADLFGSDEEMEDGENPQTQMQDLFGTDSEGDDSDKDEENPFDDLGEPKVPKGEPLTITVPSIPALNKDAEKLVIDIFIP